MPLVVVRRRAAAPFFIGSRAASGPACLGAGASQSRRQAPLGDRKVAEVQQQCDPLLVLLVRVAVAHFAVPEHSLHVEGRVQRRSRAASADRPKFFTGVEDRAARCAARGRRPRREFIKCPPLDNGPPSRQDRRRFEVSVEELWP